MKTTVAQFLLAGLVLGQIASAAYADPYNMATPPMAPSNMSKMPASNMTGNPAAMDAGSSMTMPGSMSQPMASPMTPGSSTSYQMNSTTTTTTPMPTSSSYQMESETTTTTSSSGRMNANDGAMPKAGTSLKPLSNPTGEVPVMSADDPGKSKLDVKTDEDKLVIKGHAASYAELQSTVANAQSSNGMSSKGMTDVTIHNQLKDIATPWAGEMIDPSKTSQAVKARVAADDMLEGSRIRVRTRDNTVFVEGKVSNWDQYLEVTQIALSEGPWKVVNRLKIDPEVTAAAPNLNYAR